MLLVHSYHFVCKHFPLVALSTGNCFVQGLELGYNKNIIVNLTIATLRPLPSHFSSVLRFVKLHGCESPGTTNRSNEQWKCTSPSFPSLSLILTNKPTRINIHNWHNEVWGFGLWYFILTALALSPTLHLIQYSRPKWLFALFARCTELHVISIKMKHFTDA